MFIHCHTFRWWVVVLGCIVVMNIGDNYKSLGCLVDEKIALLNLKNVFNHKNISVPPTWGGGDEDCCRWEGVTCDDVFSKRILNLSLILTSTIDSSLEPPDEGLFLDASLFQPFQELKNFTFNDDMCKWQGFKGPLRLTKLKVLDLSNNRIYVDSNQVEIPGSKYWELYCNNMSMGFPELTKLSSLELLNLRSNGIAGTIPPSIWDLTSLKVLGLSDNMLNGSLPEGLCKLTKLEELDLSSNEFEGVIPICLSNLTSLRLLQLSGNKFSGSIPSNLFSGLKSLEYVSLSYNLFDSFSFSSIANNSKLEVFELVSHNPKLKVETENVQWKPPYFQLKILRLSNCTLNEPTGVVPSFLLSQNDLRFVDLSNNGMTGELPSWLLTNNSRLEFLSLRNNYFSGQLMLQLDSYNSYMGWLDVSMNHVAGEIPTFIGSILPNLTYLNMSTNEIEGSIPTSIENMKNLWSLDLSHNHLSGEIPRDLFNGCEQLNLLKLSNNNLGGNLTNFSPKRWSGEQQLEALYLDSNNFTGDLQQEILHDLPLGWLRLLDISNNSFTGRFPDWIAELSHLTTLVLSKNNFEGKLPISFCKLGFALLNLDLSWNNFNDTLPSCTDLPLLSTLHLQGNGFHGPLPSSLSRSSGIMLLDVRDNKFSGLIPTWISSLSQLRILLLKGNLFHGLIPLELCQLENLSILDLAANNLSGSIPPCLFHIPFGQPKSPDYKFTIDILEEWMPSVSTSMYSYENKLHVGPDLSTSFGVSNVPEEVQFVTKGVSKSYTGKFLYFMVGVDLSLNRLTGPIPMHIDNWDNVHSLNLSYNYFNGSIPGALSSLMNLESLDLSYNMLSGKIPPQITELNFLTMFSVAYNNLSGPTPKMTNQFGTFDARSYEGNPSLCGLPLDTSCSGGSTKMPHAKPSTEPNKNDISFKTSFWWSFFGSFVVSCIGAFIFFYFNTNVPQIFLGWIGLEMIPRRRTVELPWKWNK